MKRKTEPDIFEVTEDKLPPDSEKGNVVTYSERGSQTLVRKSNELIQNAMYSLTLSQQKLILHIFAMIKPSDTELPRYEISIYEFLKLCGIDPHNGSMYNQVKKNIEDIANTPVQWIRIQGTQKITMFRWIESATIDQSSGKILLTLSPILKPHLIQLKELYTTMDVTYIMMMKSQYSVRVYELCKSYQNLYLQNKQRGKPLIWDLEQFKKQVDCSAQNWAHLRRSVLDKAKAEINGHTDIIFDYEICEKEKTRVTAISVTIEPVGQDEANKNLSIISSALTKRKKRMKNHPIADGEEFEHYDKDPSIVNLDYVSSPESTIPYSFGSKPEELKKEIEIHAKIEKLRKELSSSEFNAVSVIIKLMCNMAGKTDGKTKLIDGGNQKFFEAMNEIIFNCKSLYDWFLGIAPRYAKHVIPAARTKDSPVPYLWKSVLEDMENYQIYISREADEDKDDGLPVYEAESVSLDEEPTLLIPDDASTKKEMLQALKKFIDEESLKKELTQSQQDALDEILQFVVYFCRRNVKSKDEGMIQGKANMQFLNSLNKCIEKYGGLTGLFKTMAITYDYDTYWANLCRDRKVKNPKAVFQSEIEKALLMPVGFIQNFNARLTQEEQEQKNNTQFKQDWTAAFDDDFSS